MISRRYLEQNVELALLGSCGVKRILFGIVLDGVNGSISTGKWLRLRA
jgi:hypothetical protein